MHVSGLFQLEENEGHYQTLPLYTVRLTDTSPVIIGLQRLPLSPTPDPHVYDTAVMVVIKDQHVDVTL